MTKKLWEPSKERIHRSALTRFTNAAEERTGKTFQTYHDLHRWSVSHLADFWSLIWDFTGVKASTRWDRVLDDENTMPGTDWFHGARLNFAENLLAGGAPSNVALTTINETGISQSYTYHDLTTRVAQIAHTLRKDGVAKGDRIAAVVTNGFEAVVAMLAVASLGAVWSSCSPDFGAAGILQRFSQIEPTVLFVTSSYNYNGKQYDCTEKNREIINALSSVRRVITIHPLSDKRLTQSISFTEYGKNAPTIPNYEQLPFLHPLYILYSSGTTGMPKCIVHSAGGTLLQHLKEHQLHCDLSVNDTLLYYTTTGWMMWNWLVTALASGTRIITYDGSPSHPTPTTLLDLIDRESVTAFGTSAAFISHLEKTGKKPSQSHALTSLKCIMSTGSPLSPSSFEYVYSSIKQDVLLASISGGTDIVSLFVGGNPCLPVYSGQIQCACLGMDVAVFSPEGKQIYEEKGELVCRKPFVSMPLAFFGDTDGSRYRAAYFEEFSSVWTQGDYAAETHEKGFVIFGRSDTVLNPGGVRIGSAELYREVLTISEVVECVAVDWKNGENTEIVLFVQLNEGTQLSDALITRIKKRLRTNASPRHVPARILQISDIPKTRSGKIVEKAVRQIIHDEDVQNREALTNPEALEKIKAAWLSE